MSFKNDRDIIANTRNTARFFVENRHIAWVALFFVLAWGIYGYLNMPQRKDPEIPVRLAVAVCPWPGMDAHKVDELVTRKLEESIAKSTQLHPPSASDFGIRSVTMDGVSLVYVNLQETVDDTEKVFNDINLKLNAIHDLPQGAGPVDFRTDFGQTAALMLTVASPGESDVEIELRARNITRAIEQARARARTGGSSKRFSMVLSFPVSMDPKTSLRMRDSLIGKLRKKGLAEDLQPLQGAGFAGLDGVLLAEKQKVSDLTRELISQRDHSDMWWPIVVEQPSQVKASLLARRGDKYTHKDLEDFTDTIKKNLQTVPQVSKVSRQGVLPRRVFLEYSQDALASYGVRPADIKNILAARNITLPGGFIEIEGLEVPVFPSGEFTSAEQIGEVLITTSAAGSPVYLRDLVEISEGYQSPPGFLNFFSQGDGKGNLVRRKAVTVAVFMRSGEQIAHFGKAVDQCIDQVKARLPDDLVLAKTSDQPRQVVESVDLFMTALYEAIFLVALVAMIGFWEWRSSLLLGLAIPLTLAMTFGMTYVLGVEIQQVSIATLIIALGLLVDDPVVAGDAVKREIESGQPNLIAAWLGPTKLARAIVFATITNIAAYLPFLLVSGNTGDFLYSLPIVMACALLASRIASMTFVPLIAYYLLRPGKKPEPTLEQRRSQGFSGIYIRIGRFSIRHRWLVFLASLVFLGAGVVFKLELKNAFFPDDVQRLSYIDVWLPNNAALGSTNQSVAQAEQVIHEVCAKYGRGRRVLKSITSFVGGGGPRFWFTVSPQLQQPNYAQLVLEMEDKDDTPKLVGPLQEALSARIPGTRIDMHQLQTNPVNYPVAVYIKGQGELQLLKNTAEKVKDVFRSIPQAARVRDNWGSESFVVNLAVDPDRANLSGITNQDVAVSSVAGMSGFQVTSLTDKDKQIPVLVRLVDEQRNQLSDIRDLYVYSTTGDQKVPLMDIATISKAMKDEKIFRRDHFPCVTVYCFPAPGELASTVIEPALERLEEIKKGLPPGFSLVIGGERAKQKEGFQQLSMVLVISVVLIFLALVIQFNNAVKPVLVFAAVPYGVTGALGALYIMGAPFGFMAFLGIASLVGVIVSHVIVLFDFIEVARENGEPLEQSLLDAGVMRLRPVLITVAATVFALFPLAVHGGPLWQPLCYAQIGGLSLAAVIELLLVPVLYGIFVLDLKWIKWE